MNPAARFSTAIVILATMVASQSTDSSNSSFDLSGSLLPQVYPQGDPAEYALPVFMVEPKDQFTAKGLPATLDCKVAHAVKVFFVCNDELMPSTSESSVVDPETSIRYTTVTLEVKRSDAMDILGVYVCRCNATSSKGEVSSRDASVRVAYLRKEFDTPPYSQQIEVGSQTELRCHPPKGNPVAWVSHWLKNGEKIDPAKDRNFIQSAAGSLLIIQARLSDMANYTCVATNDALERQSQPALLTVYVSGMWSEWGEWSECSVQCGRGVSKRNRLCNNPAPINGGPGCKGPALQKKSCNEICPGVDGKWSSWASWSSCSADCLQFRRRDCNNPAPKHSGRYCMGKDIDSQNCTGGSCKIGLHSIVLYGTEPTTEATPTVAAADLTLFIGLGLAFVIFTVVVCVIFKLLRRKNEHYPNYGLTPGGCEIGKPGDVGRRDPKAISYMPDLTRGAHSACYEEHYADKNQLNLSDHFYEQPMAVFNPRPFPNDNLENSPFLPSSNSSDNMISSTPKPRASDIYLPQNVDFHSTGWAIVSESGTRLSAPDSNVSLTVPQGAVIPGELNRLYVTVLRQDKCSLRLDSMSTPLTPVVQFGSMQGDHLLKPVVLSMPHVGGVNGDKKLTLKYCKNTDGPLPIWETVKLNERIDTRGVFMQLDNNMVHLVTSDMGAYVLLANLNDLSPGSGTITSSSSSSSNFSSMKPLIN